MTIRSNNVIKYLSVFAAIFWGVVVICGIYDLVLKDDLDKGGLLDILALALPVVSLLVYSYTMKYLLGAVREHQSSKITSLIPSLLWVYSPVILILYCVYLVFRMFAQ